MLVACCYKSVDGAVGKLVADMYLCLQVLHLGAWGSGRAALPAVPDGRLGVGVGGTV